MDNFNDDGTQANGWRGSLRRLFQFGRFRLKLALNLELSW